MPEASYLHKWPELGLNDTEIYLCTSHSPPSGRCPPDWKVAAVGLVDLLVENLACSFVHVVSRVWVAVLGLIWSRELVDSFNS